MLGEEWVSKAWDWIKDLEGEKLETLNRINQVVMAWDPRDLAKIYVEPDFQATNPADMPGDEIEEDDEVFRIPSYRWLDAFLGKPKKKDGRHVAFVLSDAGMGKTSLLAMLRLTALQGQWPGKSFELFRLGPETLENIEAIESPMDTVLLLDSLDEDEAAHGRISKRIEEILKATQSFRQVIITCRTQFFPFKSDYERGGTRIKIAGFTCKKIYLSLFSERQIQVCLEKQFLRDEEKIERAKKLLGKMQSLSMRPMLLGYVDDLLDRENLIEGKERTPFTTYRAMVQAWLDREERKPRSRVRSDELLAACHVMAISLQQQGRRAMGPGELGRLLRREDIPDAIREIDDIGGRSLLNLNSDGEYRFAHYSIQEFLVVDHMARFPEAMREYSGDIQYSDELLRFLSDWSLQAEGWRAHLGKANLTNVRLVDVNLSGADLSGADLGGADLGGADLSRAGLYGAKLLAATLNSTILIDARLRLADLRDADLSGADLGGADLSDANLSNADLIEANLSSTDLSNANLSSADLFGTDLRGARNLTQEQINSAHGNADTRIAKNLRRPEHWTLLEEKG